MPSIRAIRLGHHPFPFLLYGEWVLVGLALISEFSPSVLPRSGGFPVLALVAILGFGALGLWLPLKPLGLQIAHVVLQFGLLVIAARLSTVGLAAVSAAAHRAGMRSCLVFSQGGRILVTSVTFMFYLGMLQNRLQSLTEHCHPA
jgi:hypothetical protein